MESYFALFTALISALAGAVLTKVTMNKILDLKLSEVKSESMAENARLSERLENKELQAKDLSSRLEAISFELEEKEKDLKKELEKRASAEQKNLRIPELEAALFEREKANEQLQSLAADLKARISEISARLDEERKAASEKLAVLDDAQKKLSDAFKALSSEALKSNNQSFLTLARSEFEKISQHSKQEMESRGKSIELLVKPLKESLEKVDTRIQEIEKSRVGAYSGLMEQLKTLSSTQAKLQSETVNLVKALRTPTVRGRWGEMQLRRVVEMAGMLAYCDFKEQVVLEGDGGKTLRPDMVVHLPNRKHLVVDSKAPLQAYLDALEATDDELKKLKLQDHARQLSTHITKLSQKSYWEQFKESIPEFVVLFLPGEPIFTAALEQDPSLIETGLKQKVLIATPTTLIALFLAVAYGWREGKIEENAKAISELGKELYERIAIFTGHFENLRQAIANTARYYNDSLGSLESRVLVTARRFKDLEVSPKTELKTILGIDSPLRPIQQTGSLELKN